MNLPLYIARRLNVSEGSGKISSILRFATVGITLAVAIMIVSIAVVAGFRKVVVDKILSLDNHIKVCVADNYITHEANPIDISNIEFVADSLNYVASVEPVIVKTTILKTSDNFQGMNLRGLSAVTDTTYLSSCMIAGHYPSLTDSLIDEIAISEHTAMALNLNVGDKVLAYFIDDNARVRNLVISGVFNTNFEDFDNNVVIGNISLLRRLNRWSDNECSYVGINVVNCDELTEKAYDIYYLIYQSTIKSTDEKLRSTTFQISNLYDENIAYFAWLELLDSNIAIILILMAFVTGFTIVAVLLIIVLNRVNTIGILKSLGSSNNVVRATFIYMAQGVVFKALVLGNIFGIALSLAQKHLHIVQLDPTSYYMQYAPIRLVWWHVLALDAGVVIFAFATLIISSVIIAKISPAQTIKYE